MILLFEEMISNVLPDVLGIVGKGLIEVSDTNVVKCCIKASKKED